MDLNDISPCTNPVIPQVIEEVPLTPQEIRAEVARERREATKARQLDRCTKRKHKRSQAY